MEKFLTDIPMPLQLKRALLIIGGGALALIAIPLVLGLCCNAQYLFMDTDKLVVLLVALNLAMVVLLLAGGGATLWHLQGSILGRPSRPVRLPPIWALVGIFALLALVSAGLGSITILIALFLPVMAALPPIWALSWFSRGEPGSFTWRRALPAFVGGATLGVFVALLLNTLLPLLFMTLVYDLGDPLLSHLEHLLSALADRRVAEAITNPAFVFLLFESAIITPLVEELAKPLATLPLIGRLPRREAFLVGASAGAGFAAVENVLYAGSAYGFWRNAWVGILLLRAVGVVHPLGSGLMGLAWRDLFNGEPGARGAWLRRYAVAAGIHGVWNGGLTLVTALAGAELFGRLPPEVDLLGISMGGTTLALLVALGLATLWLGRSIARQAARPGAQPEAAPDARLVLSDRAMAIWALACLAALAPLGITALQLMLR